MVNGKEHMSVEKTVFKIMILSFDMIDQSGIFNSSLNCISGVG
jgi:hypothetical protein